MDYKEMWNKLEKMLEKDLLEKVNYQENAIPDKHEDRIRQARINEIEKILTLMGVLEKGWM